MSALPGAAPSPSRPTVLSCAHTRREPMEKPMTKPLRLALLAAFALAAMAIRAQACNVECNEGEAYNDEAELCMPVGSFSW